MPLPDLFQPALSRRLIYKEGIRFPRRGKIVSLRIVLAIYAIITEMVGLFFPPSIGVRVLEFFEIYVIGLYIDYISKFRISLSFEDEIWLD